jgi:hypothetical protein
VINPVEQIVAARRRLKQVAALRAGLALFVPALTALVLAAALRAIGRATWERAGYVLAPAKLGDLRLAAVLAGVAAMAGCSLMAWRAWREADNFIDAAERVDDAVGGHQEIVTLASLADPAEPPAQRAHRTPLFPVLWRRAAGYLERFDANRAFGFEVRRPLVRSLPMGAVILVILAAAALALVRPPTAEQLEARRLRTAAKELASSPSSADNDLASKLLAAADALENPDLPPQEKLARLAEAMSELQKQQQGSSPQQSASNSSGSSSGKGNSGKGTGQGNGQGQDSGNGKGKGQGKGLGENQGNNPNGPKSKEQIVELQNDLSKAQAQIESGEESKNSAPKSGQGDKGNTLKPGSNPNKKGSSQQPDATAQGNIPLPRPNASAMNEAPAGGTKGGKNEKGGHGDTHLGEFPVPENFPRFYKPGEGPAIEIRDARYVLFRLPTEVVSASGGKLVPDTNRPTANVPYTNVPLKAERIDATPQERQLVPPRYRDLIH